MTVPVVVLLLVFPYSAGPPIMLHADDDGDDELYEPSQLTLANCTRKYILDDFYKPIDR